MTQFLGYLNYGDEYKLMGLAAYGEPKYFEKLKDNLFFEHSDQLVKLNLKFFNHQKRDYQYIAEEKLIIDQIYNDEFLKLFNEEIKNKDKKEEFSKILHVLFRKFMNFFSKKY